MKHSGSHHDHDSFDYDGYQINDYIKNDQRGDQPGHLIPGYSRIDDSLPSKNGRDRINDSRDPISSSRNTSSTSYGPIVDNLSTTSNGSFDDLKNRIDDQRTTGDKSKQSQGDIDQTRGSSDRFLPGSSSTFIPGVEDKGRPGTYDQGRPSGGLSPDDRGRGSSVDSRNRIDDQRGPVDQNRLFPGGVDPTLAQPDSTIPGLNGDRSRGIIFNFRYSIKKICSFVFCHSDRSSRCFQTRLS